jgi:hypothetical protein
LYLKSQTATTTDDVIDLLIADKKKECLPSGASRYVLGLKGDDIYNSNKIANTADDYSSNYTDNDSYKATSLSKLPLHDKFVSYGTKCN